MDVSITLTNFCFFSIYNRILHHQSQQEEIPAERAVNRVRPSVTPPAVAAAAVSPMEKNQTQMTQVLEEKEDLKQKTRLHLQQLGEESQEKSAETEKDHTLERPAELMESGSSSPELEIQPYSHHPHHHHPYPQQMEDQAEGSSSIEVEYPRLELMPLLNNQTQPEFPATQVVQKELEEEELNIFSTVLTFIILFLS